MHSSKFLSFLLFSVQADLSAVQHQCEEQLQKCAQTNTACRQQMVDLEQRLQGETTALSDELRDKSSLTGNY